MRRPRKIGNAHIFESLITRDVARARLVDEFLSLFGGRMQPVMAQLIEAGNLTPKDVADAERLLRSSRPNGRKTHDPWAAGPSLAVHIICWRCRIFDSAATTQFSSSALPVMVCCVPRVLFPFAILSALGESLSRLFPASVPRLMLEIQPAAERLSAPAQTVAAFQQAPDLNLVPIVTAIWLTGLSTVLTLRLVRWFGLRAVMRQARALELAVPVDVKASTSLLEPGLVGILRPVVILPEGLMSQLSQAERDAILAHELSHFCRDDNLTASIHMLVEALFWFYPLVWLIGAKLIAERERACDENVLAQGHDAEVYARGILKVCHFCVQSPLACASGATGADLANRLRQIMSGDTVSGLQVAQKLMLAAALCLALGLPLAGGSLPPSH